MTHGHTAASLIAFELRVAAAFEAGQIRAPIHLCSDGQAEPLLEIFEDIAPADWVLSTWRSHWHCLLKGVPEDEVFAAILAGRSMYLSFREQRVFCSAIVGGILPIAVGIGMGIKRAGGSERVHVFVGDMTARTGLFYESAEYARRNNLPVRFVIEDNKLSTNARTLDIWGTEWATEPQIRGYQYTRNRPHTGTGRRVTF